MSHKADSKLNYGMEESNVEPELKITHLDKVRILKSLKAVRHTADMKKFEAFAKKIESATLIDSTSVPDNLVTMNSRVRYQNLASEDEHIAVIVYPKYAHAGKENISVLSPFGVALFGSLVGQEIEYASAGNVCNKLRILQILYQPEMAGHYLI